MTWSQVYDPLGAAWLSTLIAALPVVSLLGLIALGRVRIHIAALLGLGVAVGSSRVDLQACKLEYSIVSPK